jgi:TetR/AcrR family transcriptional regulator, regulator of cefoperazone and chloramphenicol sensitivity
MMAGRDPATRRTTRTAIVEAAMRGFAEKGYAATSIREIAALAGTNVASISYHFGGKEGLRAACAERIVEVLGGVLDAAQPSELPSSPEAAEAVLVGLVRTMSRFILLEPEAGLVAGFVLREMSAPSGALDTIYTGLFERVHRRACALWGVATGRDPESDTVRLAVFGAIGQLVYFHIARPVVLRRMGWASIGPAEAGQIADGLLAALAARLAADRTTP